MDENIQKTQMDKDKTWGTFQEILVFSHLLQTRVLSYDVPRKMWGVHSRVFIEDFSSVSLD